jgi:hypothetical protein
MLKNIVVFGFERTYLAFKCKFGTNLFHKLAENNRIEEYTSKCCLFRYYMQ